MRSSERYQGVQGKKNNVSARRGTHGIDTVTTFILGATMIL